MKKIAVVGATGPTGRLVVSQALSRGHEVVVYARRPEAIESHHMLNVIGGELNNLQEFADAISDSDVVICTLGTRSRMERNFMSKHLPMVTAAMEHAGVQHLVLMSALGGGALPKAVRGIPRLVFWFLSAVVFRDRTQAEAALAQTALTWSAVYPAFLSDADALADVQLAEVDAIVNTKNSRIPRANVATALLDLVDSPRALRLAIAPVGTLTTGAIDL